MDPEQFKMCKQIDKYDEFMKTALDIDQLTMEDYQQFMPNVFGAVLHRSETNPIEMFERVIESLAGKWTASPALPFHGPWHHGIVPGVLVKSLQNNGYDLSAAEVKEALKRGLQIPAGSCGFHGVCGAGSALGIVVSILLKSNPFHDERRSQALAASAKIFGRIAKLGGPRCCRLSAYTVISQGVGVLKQLGYDLPTTKMADRCLVHAQNADCHEARCPYYPKHA